MPTYWTLLVSPKLVLARSASALLVRIKHGEFDARMET